MLLLGAISNQDIIAEAILPIVFSFMKDGNSEISVGVARSLAELSKTLSKEQL